jgi:hypothetical protein
VGVASQMVVALCERLGRKVRIIHNDRCIWDFTPERPQHGEMIVLSVWGDHAFFYRDTHGAQGVKMAPVAAIPELKLASRVDYERVPYSEMEPWPEVQILTSELDVGIPTTGTFRTDRICEVLHDLREAKLNFRVRHRTASVVSSIRMGQVRIKAMPPAAELLSSIAQALAKRVPFVYYGETEGAFATRFFEALLSKRRPSRIDRGAVLERQGGLCGKCGDPLEEYEVHHEVSIRDGGDSDPKNLVALCLPCHDIETEKQGHFSRHSFWSELGPDATELWERTPKPAQLVWGSGSRRDVECLDVKACRPSALLESRLPVFGPADDPEPYDRESSSSTTTSGWLGGSCRTSGATWRPTTGSTSTAREPSSTCSTRARSSTTTSCSASRPRGG